MKKIFSFFICIFLLCSCSSCQQEKSITGIRKLTMPDLSKKAFYCGTIYDDMTVKIKHKGEFENSDIQVVIGDNSVINIDFKIVKKNFFSTYIDFEIQCLKEGATDFYFKTADNVVYSEKTKINVLKNITAINLENQEELLLFKGEVRHDNLFYITSHEKVDMPRSLIECVSENTDIATVKFDESYEPNSFKINCFRVGETYIYLETKDKSVKSKKLKIIVREPTPNDVFDKGKTVYTTPHGTKYHYDEKCAGKNATATTENSAILNHEPCKRCAR